MASFDSTNSTPSSNIQTYDEDPVENMIKKTGCMDSHYKVQECIVEHRDWRQCQNEVRQFRQCMANYTASSANDKTS